MHTLVLVLFSGATLCAYPSICNSKHHRTFFYAAKVVNYFESTKFAKQIF